MFQGQVRSKGGLPSSFSRPPSRGWSPGWPGGCGCRTPPPRLGKVPPVALGTGRSAALARAAATNTPPGLGGRRVAPPSPRRRRHKHPAPASPPPPSRSVNPSPPAARLRGGGRARGWSCRVSSRERPGRRPACLQAPGLVAAAQARAARPPSAQASRLPGAAEGGQVPGPPRRRRRRRPGRGREEGHRGGGRPGQAGEGAEEGRSRAASGPPALGALAAQIIRALEREAESGSRRKTRKSRRFIAFAPHLPDAPHPPSPTTGSRAAAARAPEAAGRAGSETTAPSLPRALPSLAPPPPPPPPRARPRAGALTSALCCPSPTPPPAPPRPAPPRPVPSAQPQLQPRRGGAAGETRMSLGRNCSAGRRAGEGRTQMTSLSYPACLAAIASRPRPQAQAEGSIRIPDRNGGAPATRLPSLRATTHTLYYHPPTR